MVIICPLLQIYILCYVARAVLSWFPPPRDGFMATANSFLFTITEPILRPVRALLIRVPLGPRPWLHRLRHRSPGFVRRLRHYYAGVRLLWIVHRRLRLFTFPPRTTRPDRAYGRSRDLPVPAQGASIHARVLDHARLAGRSR